MQMEKMVKHQEEMYQSRRIQMYIVFIRLLFTLLCVVSLIMVLVNSIAAGSPAAAVLPGILIMVLYVINIPVYHYSMKRTEVHYQYHRKIYLALSEKSEKKTR